MRCGKGNSRTNKNICTMKVFKHWIRGLKELWDLHPWRSSPEYYWTGYVIG